LFSVQIQSATFDVAYNSNENLLISAPTGAGKTNIALLTVVREIKLHMVQDVIKKNEFKVVTSPDYVNCGPFVVLILYYVLV